MLADLESGRRSGSQHHESQRRKVYSLAMAISLFKPPRLLPARLLALIQKVHCRVGQCVQICSVNFVLSFYENRNDHQGVSTFEGTRKFRDR